MSGTTQPRTLEAGVLVLRLCGVATLAAVFVESFDLEELLHGGNFAMLLLFVQLFHANLALELQIFKLCIHERVHKQSYSVHGL